MSLPFPRRGIGAWAALCALLSSASADAQFSRDRAARAKIDEALERYLRTEFESAESLLSGTIRACEERCRPRTIARAWMYVGVIRGSGKSAQEAALDAFGRALDTDPAVELDAELATDDTRATWQLALEGRPPRARNAEPKTEPDGVDDPPDPPEESIPDICPPGLPGCVAEHGRCQASAECKKGLACQIEIEDTRGTCEALIPCVDECARGTCQRGFCQPGPAPSPTKKHWLGLHAALDFVHLPSASNACQRPYHCFDGSEAVDESAATDAGGVAGGLLRGTTRLLASYEYRLSETWSLGGRAGLALGGAPSGFLPVHAELRLGARLPGPAWLSPALHLGGGLAEFDARLPVRIGAGDTTRAVDAYGAFGRTFASAGGSLTLLFSKTFGVELGASAAWLFPDQAWLLEPSLGVVTGF